MGKEHWKAEVSAFEIGAATMEGSIELPQNIKNETALPKETRNTD